MASCRKWILNIHSFTIWIKNEQLPVDHTFWWPILRKKFREIFTLVWEAISKTRASGFISRSKHLETIKALGRSGLVLSSVSRCLEPLIKPSHSLLIYYIRDSYFPCGRKGIICTAVGDIAAGNAIFAASKGSLGDVSLIIYQYVIAGEP